MENQNKLSEVSWGPEISWEQFSHVYQVLRDEGNRMVGKVMQIIEAAGMEGKQEESIKKLVKDAIWDSIVNGMDMPVRRCVPKNQVPGIEENNI